MTYVFHKFIDIINSRKREMGYFLAWENENVLKQAIPDIKINKVALLASFISPSVTKNLNQINMFA